MDQVIIYIALLGVIVMVGHAFHKSTIPSSLLLMITGMLLSFIPHLPEITLNPNIVLDIFLPLLLYEISAFTAWKEMRKDIRPIILLSIGHVLFITVLVAVVAHTLLPALGWGLAFVLGAVISPPDDVAILSVAQKTHIPARIVSILNGEGMFNDATALILFRFALAAIVTHQFSVALALSSFVAILLCETFYGLAIGWIMGEFRRRIQNNSLHVVASLLTPFIAYIPPVLLGGSGVLATVMTGFVISNRYTLKFTPEFRLVSRAIWPSLAFVLQSLLFLLVGLDLRSILERISSISFHTLALYTLGIVFLMVVGRFVWVFGAVYFLPRLLSAKIRKRDPLPPWQYPIIISWAGMRGGISLAAALAIPLLPFQVEGTNPRDLIIFLVFSAIVATLLIQGLTLPWLIKMTGAHKYGQREKYAAHLSDMAARLHMIKASLHWLHEYKHSMQGNPKIIELIDLHISEYQMMKTQLEERLASHQDGEIHDEKGDFSENACLLTQLIEVEREALVEIWRKEKISLAVMQKHLERLDHRAKNMSGIN